MNNYLLWNKQAGHVGNNILFWRKNGNGYTCDIDDAEHFTEFYAKEYAEKSFGKFIALKFSDMESISTREVDIQVLLPYLEQKGE